MIIKVKIKTLDSRDFDFEVDDDWTTLQLKEHIHSTVDVSPNDQRLIYCGRVLQNDKKLSEYSCNEKVVHLVPRPPPPPPSENSRSSDSNNNSSNTTTTNPDGSTENIRIIGDSGILFNTTTLLPNSDLNQVLRRVAQSVERAFGRGGMPIPVGTSIGVTISPQILTTQAVTVNPERLVTTNSSGNSQVSQQSFSPPQNPPLAQSVTEDSTQTTQSALHLNPTISQSSNSEPKQPSRGPEYTPEGIIEALRNHPDWIPTIKADISKLERQIAEMDDPPL